MIRKLILRRILDRGIKISWLAGQVGVSDECLYGYLAGRTRINVEAAEKVMEILDIEISLKD